MQQGERSRANYGTLERWTIALFAISVIFSVPAILAGLVCMACSRFWTLKEKLFAVFAPLGIALVLFMFVAGGSSMQNWIRIPMMFTLSGGVFLIAAVILYTRSRQSAATAATAN